MHWLKALTTIRVTIAVVSHGNWIILGLVVGSAFALAIDWLLLHENVDVIRWRMLQRLREPCLPASVPDNEPNLLPRAQELLVL